MYRYASHASSCGEDDSESDLSSDEEAKNDKNNTVYPAFALPTHFYFGVEIDRGRSEGGADNDDDIEGDNDEDEQEGDEAYRRDKGAPQVDNTSSDPSTNNVDDNAPLSPWREVAKQRNSSSKN